MHPTFVMAKILIGLVRFQFSSLKMILFGRYGWHTMVLLSILVHTTRKDFGSRVFSLLWDPPRCRLHKSARFPDPREQFLGGLGILLRDEKPTEIRTSPSCAHPSAQAHLRRFLGTTLGVACRIPNEQMEGPWFICQMCVLRFCQEPSLWSFHKPKDDVGYKKFSV